MKKFVTSDLHLLHNKMAIIRGYDSYEKMNEDIISIWNNTVSENDTVLILGDLSIDSSYNKLYPLLIRLNGKKIVVPGNHDKPSVFNRLHDEGIIFLCKDIIYEKELYNDEIINIQYCHYPISHWRKKHHGSYHLFGHTHGMYNPSGKCIDVGWCKWGKPMLLDDILNIIDKKILNEE